MDNRIYIAKQAKIRFSLLFECIFIFCCGTVFRIEAQDSLSYEQKKTINISQDVDEIAKKALSVFSVPGVAVGIFVDGKVVVAKGYGVKNVEKALPVTENTLFAIGSCTKAFTAFILAQLVDEGKLSWDDAVVKYLPEFRLQDPFASPQVTIRDLLAHRTGLARHDMLWGLNSQFKRADILKALPYLEPACGLREKFQYNNLMYTIAGMVVEKITGQSWEEAVSRRIFIPLGMSNSNTSIDSLQKSEDFSMPYDAKAGKGAIAFRDLQAVAPAGAINSNVSDMLKWIRLQLSDGIYLGNSLVSKERVQEMHTVQMETMNAPPSEEIFAFGYGLGWGTGVYGNKYLLQHQGGIDGFISMVSLVPSEKIGIVVLTNSGSEGSYVAAAMSNTILDALLGRPKTDWISFMKKEEDQALKAKEEEVFPEIVSHKTPVRAFEEYVGLYENPAYGPVVVQYENNQLFGTYGDVTFPLTHKWYDLFSGTKELSGDILTFPFSFSYDFSGDICELEIPFQEGVKPIVFRKVQEKNKKTS